jgi:hypothetical protein
MPQIPQIGVLLGEDYKHIDQPIVILIDAKPIDVSVKFYFRMGFCFTFSLLLPP